MERYLPLRDDATHCETVAAEDDPFEDDKARSF